MIRDYDLNDKIDKLITLLDSTLDQVCELRNRALSKLFTTTEINKYLKTLKQQIDFYKAQIKKIKEKLDVEERKDKNYKDMLDKFNSIVTIYKGLSTKYQICSL